MTRNCLAGPIFLNGPCPATASAPTSGCARPELTMPPVTESTFATEPCDARVDTIRPDGPHALAASQRPTPGGWLSTWASRLPTGEKVPVLEPVEIWKEAR